MLIYLDLVPSLGGGSAVRRSLPSPEAQSDFRTLHGAAWEAMGGSDGRS
jgi:hypothetical protein